MSGSPIFGSPMYGLMLHLPRGSTYAAIMEGTDSPSAIVVQGT